MDAVRPSMAVVWAGCCVVIDFYSFYGDWVTGRMPWGEITDELFVGVKI